MLSPLVTMLILMGGFLSIGGVTLLYRWYGAQHLLNQATFLLHLAPERGTVRFSLNGCPATLTASSRRLRLVVDLSDLVPEGIHITRWGESKIQVLDQQCDSSLDVAGIRRNVLSIMSREVRQALSRAADESWPSGTILDDSHLSAKFRSDEIKNLPQYSQHAHALIDALRRLPATTPERLLANYTSDDDRTFGRQCLVLLLNNYTESETVARGRALATSRGDLDPQGKIGGRLALVPVEEDQGLLSLSPDSGAVSLIDEE